MELLVTSRLIKGNSSEGARGTLDGGEIFEILKWVDLEKATGAFGECGFENRLEADSAGEMGLWRSGYGCESVGFW